MENEILLSQVREKQQDFIACWINEVSSRMELKLQEVEWYAMGNELFAYITDLHLPAERHPVLKSAMERYRQPDYGEGPLTCLSFSSLCWRRALLEVGEEWLSLGLFKQFNSRIDRFELEVRRFCTVFPPERVKEDSVAYDTMHEDRINLIGKMAASMAHEIRNPLTSIKGFLKLLRAGIQKQALDKSETYLNFIEHECDNILMQVTGFLSFSKKPIIEEEKVCISVKQILDHNLSLLNPRLINENVDLALSVSCGTKLKVQKLAIQQVLSNLLNNGIDALSGIQSDKKMNISCYEDASHIYIRVSNNGPRIPASMARTIFTPFVTDKENGTGLGLAICKQIMTKNNGDITFSSDERETVFKLTFSRSG